MQLTKTKSKQHLCHSSVVAHFYLFRELGGCAVLCLHVLYTTIRPWCAFTVPSSRQINHIRKVPLNIVNRSHSKDQTNSMSISQVRAINRSSLQGYENEARPGEHYVGNSNNALWERFANDYKTREVEMAAGKIAYLHHKLVDFRIPFRKTS